MQRIETSQLKPGMVVARPIFSSDGRVLLHSGNVLNQTYISRLNTLGILSVYIKDEVFGEVPFRDVISEETRLHTMRVVRENFTSLEHQCKLNIREVQNTVDNIIDEVLSNYSLLVQLSDIRAFDDYTFGHSVNVCILSIMTGINLGYHELQLKELGIGALLHDVGKIRIDPALLNKPGDLTHEEYQEIKRHTEYGFEILRQYNELSLLSAHIAYQHHERWDGKGYPRGLAREAIHEYARIVAVADVYDALMADRPYRPSYNLNQALHIIKRMAGIFLSPDSVNALIANIAIYPIGTIVVLNSGDIGIVVDTNREHPAQPVVKIVFDPCYNRVYDGHEVDLSKLNTIRITKTCDEDEVAELRFQARLRDDIV